MTDAQYIAIKLTLGIAFFTYVYFAQVLPSLPDLEIWLYGYYAS